MSRWHWAGALLVLAVAATVAVWPRGGGTGSGASAPAGGTADLAAARARAGVQPCPAPTPGATAAGPLAGVRASCLGDGSTVDVGAVLAGRPALINAWATWCQPCREELPVLQAYASTPGAIPVLGVQIKSDPAGGLDLLASLGVRFPSVHDGDDAVSTALRLPNNLPVSYVVAADGTLHRVDPPTPAGLVWAGRANGAPVPDGRRSAVRLRGKPGLAVVIVAASVLAACSSTTDKPGNAPNESGQEVYGHVHGLGVDPADGTMYVATHHGLLRLAAQGKLEPVGAQRRDLMGFTVAGPGTFLASGHPAPGEATPNPLGLVESRDKGNTWTTLALSGKSDFHALDSVATTVYGFDGTLKASTDGGRTWETRSSPKIADIAINPKDPNVVAATTEAGVAVSRDGGRTFGAAQGPVVVFVVWSAQGTMYGLAPDSALYRSTDGAHWTKAAAVPGGRPQALGLGPDGRVLVATGGGVFESRDQAATVSKLA